MPDDAGEVFRSLLKQLILQGDPCDIPKDIIDAYKRSKKDGSYGKSLTVEESVQSIISLSKGFSETFLVIDGIDQVGDRERLFDALDDLRDSVKLFVSSR